MRRLNLLLLAVVSAVAIVAVARAVITRGDVKALRGITGVVDRCETCHPDGSKAGKPHPRIEGHEKLPRLGCVTCHGGDGRRADKGAHGPLPGEGPSPFFPRPFFQVGCARCHVPGRVKGAEQLARGQREYVDAGCVGCHVPGRRGPGPGYDLRFRPTRTIAELRMRLLDPRHAEPPATMMWTLRDGTYRDRFDASPEGQQALDALIAYLLVLTDSPEPFRKAWARPELRVDVTCTKCHERAGARPAKDPRPAGAKGKAEHRCPELAGSKTLRCDRCHTAGQQLHDAKREQKHRCPQIRAALPLCSTCHQREADHSADLKWSE